MFLLQNIHSILKPKGERNCPLRLLRVMHYYHAAHCVARACRADLRCARSMQNQANRSFFQNSKFRSK